ncbi:MAG: extracellular solute-binding protein [Treponema sp.]|jgi:putative aldouronate transport system substrate-binding protein|nr:extracellular solute-binding protein [Treponema sp.]
MIKKLSAAIIGLIALAALGCAKTKGAAKEIAKATSFNETGMPIVNEPVELTVLTMRWGDMGDTFTKNQWLVDLEKRSNVTIKWQVVSSSDWGEQKGILLAGNTLPDIFLGNATINDGDIMNNPEYFRPLDDLIAAYMPRYQAATAAIPALKNVSVFPDGRIYSLAKNLPSRPKTRNHPVINKKWLERLGLEVPKNLQELTAVLKAFKEKDANGNGDPNDEYPLSFSRTVHIDLLNPFGITDIYESLMTVKDGVPFFYPASAEYRAAYRWVRELYEAGCIDPESFTQDDAMLNGKRLNADAPLVGMSFEWTAEAVFGKWAGEYEAIAPIAGPDGARYAGGDPNGVFSIMRNEAEITSACAYPEVAARWLDEFYTSEASIQNFWGALGTVIAQNADGTYRLNDPPAGVSADAWYWEQSLRDFGPKFVVPGFDGKLILSPASGDGLKMATSAIADPFVMEPYPQVIFTVDETNALATLGTDIGEYVRQMQAKWTTRGGIDADWDAYIARLNAMGLERFVQIKLDAYKRYKGI